MPSGQFDGEAIADSWTMTMEPSKRKVFDGSTRLVAYMRNFQLGIGVLVILLGVLVACAVPTTVRPLVTPEVTIYPTATPEPHMSV